MRLLPYGWSRSVLVLQIKSRLPPQSDGLSEMRRGRAPGSPVVRARSRGSGA